MLILSYENEISFTCKLNSFSYELLCTRLGFEREALGNSEMVYYDRDRERKFRQDKQTSAVGMTHSQLSWTRRDKITLDFTQHNMKYLVQCRPLITTRKIAEIGLLLKERLHTFR